MIIYSIISNQNPYSMAQNEIDGEQEQKKKETRKRQQLASIG